MEVSEARLTANRANAARSRGPITEEGKAVSRRNSLKHGLTGAGIVLLEGDQLEVESRVEALHAELQPQSSIGSMLIRKIATLSVRSERAAEHENAAINHRVRNAFHAFDEERHQRVDDLFAALPDSPVGALRNLKRMPEGVDRLVDAWKVLRRDLDREGQNLWGSSQLAHAANLIGMRALDAHSSRIGDLSCAIWGEFHGLTARDGADLDDEGRRQWARVELLKLVDLQIAELEAHWLTLDHDRIEQDRREAPIRATFDDSKEATLARRYEADADRGFYKALKEFRKVEAEATTRIETAPTVQILDHPESKVGSFCEAAPPRDREQALVFLNDPAIENPVVLGANGAPLSISRPTSPPV